MYYVDGSEWMDNEETKEEIHGLVFFYPGLDKGIVKIIEINITSEEARRDVERFSKHMTQVLYVQNERTQLVLEGSKDYKRTLD